MNAGDEKVLLKGQITKQREQIILKAKAATAGWDAAAQSDERYVRILCKAEVAVVQCILVCGPVPTLSLKLQTRLPRNTSFVSKCDVVWWDALIDNRPFSLCRLDVEVERAFKKGFAEERQKHIDDMKALNAAIEVKETRITELLVAMAAMEKKVGLFVLYRLWCVWMGRIALLVRVSLWWEHVGWLFPCLS
jgi:hypothetical protein